MGSVLSASGKPAPSSRISFASNATPSGSELDIVAFWQSILDEGKRQMAQLNDYPGALVETQLAIKNPTPENESKCFEKLMLCVERTIGIYRYCKLLKLALPDLAYSIAGEARKVSTKALNAANGNTSSNNHNNNSGNALPLSSPNNYISDQDALRTRDAIVDALNTKPATAKLLISIIELAYDFDQLRIKRPSISNDLSFYKRLLPSQYNKPGMAEKIIVTEEMVNAVPSSPMPMFDSLKNGFLQAKIVRGPSRHKLAQAYKISAKVELNVQNNNQLEGKEVSSETNDEKVDVDPIDALFAQYDITKTLRNGSSNQSVPGSSSDGLSSDPLGIALCDLIAVIANTCSDFVATQGPHLSLSVPGVATAIKASAVSTAIYDIVTDDGFGKRSAIKGKQIITQLQQAERAGDVVSHNIVRYSCPSLSNGKAPDHIMSLYEED